MDIEPASPRLPGVPSLTEIIQLTRNELTTPQVQSTGPGSSNHDHDVVDTAVNDTTPSNSDDPIRECGRAALSLLPRDPEMCRRLAYQQLHDVPYKEVKTCWRRLYIDAALWKSLRLVESLIHQYDYIDGREQKREGDEDWVTQVVKELDMGLILTGAPAREELIELWFVALQEVLNPQVEKFDQEEGEDGERAINKESDRGQRPVKKRKLNPSSHTLSPDIPDTFPTTLPAEPILQHPISCVENPSLEAFQKKLSNPATQTPLIIKGSIEHWPALHDRPWNKPSYLLSHTLGGRRLVPIEVGRSYTEENWGQKIITFGDFLQKYMLHHQRDQKEHQEHQGEEKEENEASGGGGGGNGATTGYLAQHDLLTQIPSLRADICIPDYCYCDPAPDAPSTPPQPPPTSTASTTTSAPTKLSEPLLNAWLGPAHTISPLHTDPYHNILAQVFGYKYIRLYAPDQSSALYPRGTDENGVNMSNTSSVDLDEGIRVFEGRVPWAGPGPGAGTGTGAGDNGNGGEGQKKGKDGEGQVDLKEQKKLFQDKFPGFKNATYVEGVLGPGECLYLPPGWWHYVRSMTASCSVSFWFN